MGGLPQLLPCRPGGLPKWATGVRAPTITVGLSGSWAASTAVEVHTMSLPFILFMGGPVRRVDEGRRGLHVLGERRAVAIVLVFVTYTRSARIV